MKSKLGNTALTALTTLCRMLLALTFLFSGFVKAVDPMGMFHKLAAYFAHWNVEIADDSLWLRIIVILLAAVEFILGVYMLLGIRKKLTSVCTLLFMAAMTLLTLYIYRYNPVPDCGCFGDAVRLTNEQTLLKNVVLLACAVVTFVQRDRLFRFVSERNQWIIALYSKIYIIVLGISSFHYLPVIDFTPYRCGVDLKAAYHNPTENTPEELLTLAFFNEDESEDLTESILSDSNYVFLLTIPQVRTADDGCNDRINDLYDECKDMRYRFYGVVAPDADTHVLEEWVDRTGAAYPFLKCDDVQLKAMVRANPGLLLLKDGVVLKKWSNNNLPDIDEFRQITSPEGVQAALQSAGNLRALFRLLLCFFAVLAVIILAERIWIGCKFYRHHIFKKRLIKQQL